MLRAADVRFVTCFLRRRAPGRYVEFDNVKVPKTNYIGGITMLLQNFVTERIGLAIQANRFARICLAESIECVSAVAGLKRATCCGCRPDTRPLRAA